MEQTTPRADGPAELGIGVVGFGWMGQVHTRAYTRVRHHYPDLAVTPRLVAVVDEVADRAEHDARPYGFPRVARHWRELVEDPEIEAVSVTVPNFLHREIGVAFAEAGKHLWIEKPVGRDLAEARDVARAVAAGGVRSTVGFNYRFVPAVAHARQLIRDGQLGRVTHASVRLLADYAAHPQGVLSWRFQRALAGSGVMGDLVSHGIDLVHHLLGDVDRLVADEAVFIPERPRPGGATSHYATGDGELGPVENEDWVACLLRLASGGRVTLEASRVSVGEQNNYGFEVHGTDGAVAWDFRRMGELVHTAGDGHQNQARTTVLVGPGHGEVHRFQPAASIPMSFDDLKVAEAASFLRSIAEQEPHGPTIDDAVRAAAAMQAMTRSLASGTWEQVERFVPEAEGIS
ncbi:Gfo/Idh/MocA family protein [Nitriliruptor alkaliphilus]|uniref:Gfo/Idh/MocA family protein n=1 Tax=Nitriliruptor alkaliphilus TaxID=427918 RepID=UPI000696F756|nr:Gfo/Idh/MocA family oxidoreductase [Nitriliruptor alkaliphilus]